ncbi:hypothetical protein D3C78_1756350 [compost metagenome]
MVAAGGVDHSVGGPGLFGQQCAVIQRADDRGDAQRVHFIRLFGVAHQAGNLVTGLDQAGGDGAADKTGSAGDEYVHGETPCVNK